MTKIKLNLYLIYQINYVEEVTMYATVLETLTQIVSAALENATDDSKKEVNVIASDTDILVLLIFMGKRECNFICLPMSLKANILRCRRRRIVTIN